MKDDIERPLEFKVPAFFAQWQMASISFFIIVLIIGIYLIAYRSRPEDGVIIKSIALIFCIAGIFNFLNISRNWFSAYYYVRLDEDGIYGENLFGKKGAYTKYSEIKKVWHKSKVWAQFSFETGSGFTFSIAGDIDFYGFIVDFITLKLNFDAEIDTKYLRQQRENHSAWRYSRRWPFRTSYQKGNLESIEAIAKDQLSKLQKNNVLNPNFSYEDPELEKARKRGIER